MRHKKNSLAVRKIQIRVNTRQYFTINSWKIKRALTSAGSRSTGKEYSFTGNNMKIYNLFGKQSGNTYKILKLHLSYDLAIPVLDSMP